MATNSLLSRIMASEKKPQAAVVSMPGQPLSPGRIPTAPCPACGCEIFWLSFYGEWSCLACSDPAAIPLPLVEAMGELVPGEGVDVGLCFVIFGEEPVGAGPADADPGSELTWPDPFELEEAWWRRRRASGYPSTAQTTLKGGYSLQ